jgi:hypothetical protein
MTEGISPHKNVFQKTGRGYPAQITKLLGLEAGIRDGKRKDSCQEKSFLPQQINLIPGGRMGNRRDIVKLKCKCGMAYNCGDVNISHEHIF